MRYEIYLDFYDGSIARTFISTDNRNELVDYVTNWYPSFISGVAYGDDGSATNLVSKSRQRIALRNACKNALVGAMMGLILGGALFLNIN